jgi:tetratricopeptide (TPR) repeat protein
MGKIIAAAVAAASVLAVAAPGSASVIVLGKSMATGCSKAALAGAQDRKALDTCNRALAEEALHGRNLAGTLVNRGVIYMRRGDLRSAMADFQDAVEQDPQLGEAWVNRGSVHIVEGRFQEGLNDTEHGLKLGLAEPERGYFNRGMAREWLEDEKGAYLDYRKAAELAPKWKLPREQLARFTVVTNPAR